MLKLEPTIDTQQWRNPSTGIMPAAFARINEGVITPLFTPTVCKDYLTDTIVFEEEGIQAESYWKFKGPIEHEHLTLALLVSKKHFLSNIQHFQEYETELGLSPTKVHDTDPGHLVGIEADPWWQTTTLHLSLFLSYVRNLTEHKIVGCMEFARGDGYMWPLLPNAKKLTSALQKVEYIRRRNAPDQVAMHALNGHYSYLTLPPAVRKKLTYHEQLNAIDPTIPLERNEGGYLLYPVT